MHTLSNRSMVFRTACLLWACVWLLPALSLRAQPLPKAFQDKLTRVQIELFRPIDSDYKALPGQQQDFQPCDFSWQSSKEKLEIRYLVLPWQAGDWSNRYPHILAARTAAHVATNDEDAIMTLLSLGAEELDAFGADWGAVYFFTPKTLFASQRHGELLVLHKEERGTILVFFLFDDPDNPALDLRFQHLAFKE